MGLIKGATKVEELATLAISHETNQVILLEFWASWCKPCHVPMKATQEMMAANEAKWGENVRAIGLNIDQDKEKAKAFI